jgi:hypothetical protein
MMMTPPLQDDEIRGISPNPVKAKAQEVPIVRGRFYNVLHQEDRGNVKGTEFQFRRALKESWWEKDN